MSDNICALNVVSEADVRESREGVGILWLERARVNCSDGLLSDDTVTDDFCPSLFNPSLVDPSFVEGAIVTESLIVVAD